VEAEGRALRRGVARVGRSLTLTVVSILLAAGGAGLMLWALYQSLLGPLGSTLSAFFTGLIALLVAGVVTWIADLIAR
jgi:hypothetical protein